MKMVSTLALGIALGLGALAAVPAAAQQQAAAQPAPARKFDLSKEGRKALAELQKAVDAKDEAAYPAALAAAQAAAKNADDRYVTAQFQLRRAVNVNSDADKLAAVQAMIQSGGATQAELPTLYGMAGGLAYNAKNYDVAADAFQKVAELDPQNVDAATNVARIRGQQKRYPEAIAQLEALIARETAASRPVSEDTYRLATQYALDSKQAPKAAQLSRQLLTAYPTKANWRIALSLYRDSAGLDKGANLDLMRLMRAAKSLEGERDWYELADTANDVGLPGETKSVLDEGVAAKAFDPNKPAFKDLLTLARQKAAADQPTLAGAEKQANAAPQGRIAANTADAYLGYGEYQKAAALYRTALQKGSVDANVVNTRLGIALALAGQKAEAEAALKAVSGPRSELAGFWLLWLGQKA